MNKCDVRWFLRIPEKWFDGNKYYIIKEIPEWSTITDVESVDDALSAIDIYITTDKEFFDLRTKNSLVDRFKLTDNVTFIDAVRIGDEFVADNCRRQSCICDYF